MLETSKLTIARLAYVRQRAEVEAKTWRLAAVNAIRLIAGLDGHVDGVTAADQALIELVQSDTLARKALADAELVLQREFDVFFPQFAQLVRSLERKPGSTASPTAAEDFLNGLSGRASAMLLDDRSELFTVAAEVLQGKPVNLKAVVPRDGLTQFQEG